MRSRTLILARFASLSPIFVALAADTGSAQLAWRELPNAPVSTTIRHDDLFFVDGNTGWVVNVVGEIHRTTDGGDSWELQAQTGELNRCVGFANAGRGWVGTLTPPNILYETFDGGETWSLAPNVPAGLPGICGLSVVDENVVYGAGVFFEPATILKTTDGGAAWDAISMAPHASTLIDVYFTSPDSGFAVGGLGEFSNSTRSRILFTSDGGASWVTRFAGTRDGEWGWKISFPSPSVGYVSLERVEGMTNHFAKTTDGGVTWTDAAFGTPNVQAIGFATEKMGWIGGRLTTTHVTTNGGASWEPLLETRNLNRIRFVHENLGYAAGKTVYKYSDPTVTAAVDPPAPSAGRRRLQLVGRNPFRTDVALSFELEREGAATLVVYDAAGARVRVLVDGAQGPGAQRFVWDGRSDAGQPAASGVYFVRLSATGREESVRVLLVR